MAEAVEVITTAGDVTAVLFVTMEEVVELVEAGTGWRVGMGMVVVVGRLVMVVVIVGALLETEVVETKLDRVPCIEARDPAGKLLVPICVPPDSLLMRLLGELLAFWDAF